MAHENPHTIHIIHIPLYYQTSSCPPPSSSSRPTTSAPYIALTSASPANRAILADCLSWGWRIEPRNTLILEEEKWLERYQQRSAGQNWNDDLWRIWQREHGVRIRQRELEDRGSGEKGRRMAVERVHGLGRWVWARTGGNAQREVALREGEERCAELRRERKEREEERIRREGKECGGSTLSVDEEVVRRLEGWKADRRSAELDGSKSAGDGEVGESLL